jgi:hypothetical protein
MSNTFTYIIKTVPYAAMLRHVLFAAWHCKTALRYFGVRTPRDLGQITVTALPLFSHNSTMTLHE